MEIPSALTARQSTNPQYSRTRWPSLSGQRASISPPLFTENQQTGFGFLWSGMNELINRAALFPGTEQDLGMTAFTIKLPTLQLKRLQCIINTFPEAKWIYLARYWPGSTWLKVSKQHTPLQYSEILSEILPSFSTSSGRNQTRLAKRKVHHQSYLQHLVQPEKRKAKNRDAMGCIRTPVDLVDLSVELLL